MFTLFVFGLVILAVGVLVGIGFMVAMKRKKLVGVITIIATVLVFIALTIVCCIRTVPTGHTGIVTTFGNVEDYTYEAGVHFTAPWRTVVNMDNRNQKATIDLECFSSDIQNVTVTYTLNYQIEKKNAQNIYRNIGVDYYTKIVVPRVQEAVKGVMARETAEALLNKRSVLSQDIKEILTEKLSTYNIEVLDTSLENLDFSDAFTDAVEAKQVAEQKSKQARIEQDQKIMEAEAAASRAEIDANAAAAVAIIAAEADLDVVKIQADAAEYAGQKDAAIIGQVRDILAKDKEAMTDEDVEHLLKYYYIIKWNGSLPETYFGSDDFYKILQSLVTE